MQICFVSVICLRLNSIALFTLNHYFPRKKKSQHSLKARRLCFLFLKTNHLVRRGRTKLFKSIFTLIPSFRLCKAESLLDYWIFMTTFSLDCKTDESLFESCIIFNYSRTTPPFLVVKWFCIQQQMNKKQWENWPFSPFIFMWYLPLVNHYRLLILHDWLEGILWTTIYWSLRTTSALKGIFTFLFLFIYVFTYWLIHLFSFFKIFYNSKDWGL